MDAEGIDMTDSRFVLEDVLDHVPFGSLYRAVDTRRSVDGRGERVALWLLPAHVGKTASLDALRREFARIRGLAHPNIARVLELDRTEAGHFQSAEFLDGETLRNVLDHLRPERLEPHEADDVLRAIGDALVYAHDREIVHGDVRAENVLVTMDHRCVLMNFMAHRLIRWQPNAAQPADDVRDFAALAYELHSGERLPAHGRLPARGGAPKRLLRAIDGVLHAKRHELGMREFLTAAGLAEDPEILPDPLPMPPPRERRPASRRSMWRFAFPFMGIAAIAFALHATGSLGAWLDAGQRLQDWSTGMLGRLPAAGGATRARGATPPDTPVLQAGAAGEWAEPAPAQPTDQVDDAPPPPSEPAGAAEPATVSFRAARVSARESQGMVSVEIVRDGGTAQVPVIWWTSEGTAHARDDFASFGKRVESFREGDVRRTLYIPLVSDSIPEATEYFEVHLATQRDTARLGDIETVTVALSDDDS